MSPIKMLGSAAALCALATSASAQGLLTERNLSAAMALTIAQTALETCVKNGFTVSVTVIDRAGLVKLQVRGDGASPHTMENSMRKAYTARTFRVSSAEFAKRMANDPVRAVMVLTNIVALAGALPIKVGDEVIGTVGVSGAPGGEKDEVCSQAGIDKVADQLK
jgi:uncharacterized protein GlcG (DUF336 family)